MMKAVLLAAAAASASAFAPAAVLPRAAKSECPATCTSSLNLSRGACPRREGGREGESERNCARLARARERECEQESKDVLVECIELIEVERRE